MVFLESNSFHAHTLDQQVHAVSNSQNSGMGVDRVTRQFILSHQSSASGGINNRAQMYHNLRILGDRQNNTLRGGAGNDLIRGRNGDDRLYGASGADQLYGDRDNDLLWGGAGNDTLSGGSGKNRLSGDRGNDSLVGGRGNDTLLGGSGNDTLRGGGGQDLLTGGAGNDQFVLSRLGSSKLIKTTVITDFVDGQDALILNNGLTFNDLTITQGSGKWSNSTVIQNKTTGEFLVILKGVGSSQIGSTDFSATDSSGNVAPISTPTPISSPDGTLVSGVVSISSNTNKFSSSDSEGAIAASGAAHIKIGTQTIYIGTQQVSSTNQNPIITSFDSSNPNNNWVKTNYEVTGADGRGYGVFWSGTNLYAVFSVDGTQGTPDQDFRRVSSGATQSWLRSYGQGGGAKVAVLAILNPATGEMIEAAYLSAILSNGKSNSLSITNLSTNAVGSLVVNAQSYFAPRRPDGQAMTQTGTGSSPFDYTVEITPDLKTVVSTSAVGWS